MDEETKNTMEDITRNTLDFILEADFTEDVWREMLKKAALVILCPADIKTGDFSEEALNKVKERGEKIDEIIEKGPEHIEELYKIIPEARHLNMTTLTLIIIKLVEIREKWKMQDMFNNSFLN